MQAIKLLSILLTTFFIFPVFAADTKNPSSSEEHVEPPTPANPSAPVKRPQREAVKLSPTVRESAPRPDDSGKMRRQAPARTEAPLQHVPALKNLYPSSSQDKKTAPETSAPQNQAPAR